MFTTV